MICLVMIVKDEAHVIGRCLESVRPYVDAWVIADTGSSDGTEDIIREVMAGMPGRLVMHEWVDFAHNRNAVLDVARDMYDEVPGAYALTIDADEVLEVGVPPWCQTEGATGRAWWPRMEDDGYHLTVNYAGSQYQRLSLIRLDKPWRWVGPIHEYLDMSGEQSTLGHLSAPTVLVRHDGARALDPETYAKDIEVLRDALLLNPADTRLRFYLAQSYRDAGDLESALVQYRTRASDHTGWEEERWFAAWQAACLTERIYGSGTQAMLDYLEVYEQNPRRAEPLLALATLHRLAGRYHTALAFAFAARDAKFGAPGPDALFVDTACYTWRLCDEIALSSYYVGEFKAAAQYALMALEHEPDDPRLQENLRLCQEALA